MAITAAVDALGKNLNVGSKVVIPCVVTGYSSSTTQGNVTLQTVYSDNPTTEVYATITVNSRQVITDH